MRLWEAIRRRGEAEQRRQAELREERAQKAAVLARSPQAQEIWVAFARHGVTFGSRAPISAAQANAFYIDVITDVLKIVGDVEPIDLDDVPSDVRQALDVVAGYDARSGRPALARHRIVHVPNA
jgi:hypothetical protein